jgi:hypothetical protein
MGGDKIVIEPLDLDNYGTWSLRMKALLIHNGLWRATEGTPTAAPSTGDAATQGAGGQVVSREDSDKALSLITLNVKDQHLVTLSACNTAKEAWDALASQYRSQLNAHRLQLRKELTLLKKSPAEPLSSYFSRARTLWTNLKVAGHTLAESEVVYSALNGLTPEYDTAVEIITTTSKDELKLDAVLIQLLPTEAKHHKNESSDGTQALYARGNQGRASHQGYGGSKKPGGNNFTKKPGNQGQKKGKCFYCGKPGHYEADCRKKAAEQKASAAHTASTSNQAVALTVTADTTSDTKSLWTIDSGSQRHLTPNLALLTELRPLQQPVKVLFGNKGVGLARTEGNAVFTTQVQGTTRTIKLCNVLHVPECTVGNLFSVKQACRHGARAVFEPNGYCHIDLKHETVMEGFSKDEGLYFTTAKPALEEAVAGAVKAQESTQLWHRRFGHMGYDNLASLVNKDLVTGINVPADDFKKAGTNVCEPCVKGKHARSPFSTSETGKASRPLELIHMDVCGPVTPVQSLVGAKVGNMGGMTRYGTGTWHVAGTSARLPGHALDRAPGNRERFRSTCFVSIAWAWPKGHP